MKGSKIVFETAAVNTGLIPYLHKEKEEARLDDSVSLPVHVDGIRGCRQRKMQKIAEKKAEEKQLREQGEEDDDDASLRGEKQSDHLHIC